MIPPGFKLVNYFLRFSPFRIRFRKFFGDFLCRFVVLFIAKRNLISFFGEFLNRRPSDSSRASGYNRNLIHMITSFFCYIKARVT